MYVNSIYWYHFLTIFKGEIIIWSENQFMKIL